MMMKNKLNLAALAGLVVLSGSVVAKDITLNDGVNSTHGLNAPNSWVNYGGDADTHDTLLQEDNEVEPGNTVSQLWDLEALIWNTQNVWDNSTKQYVAAPNTKTLGILSGYDLANGITEPSNYRNENNVRVTNGMSSYLPGDIFLSIDGTPNPVVANPSALPNGALGYQNINNRTTGAGAGFLNSTDNNGIAFEYVIHFDNQNGAGTTGSQGGLVVGDTAWNGNFTVYKLTAGSTLRSVSFENRNNQGNPWRYLGGVDNNTPSNTADDAQVVATGTAKLFGGTLNPGKLTDAQAKTVSNGVGVDVSNSGVVSGRSFLGDQKTHSASHYYLEIPMDWVNPPHGLPTGNTDLGGHITMGCGNDELAGRVSFQNTSVPDGGTSMLLLGAGLTGISLLSRRVSRR